MSRYATLRGHANATYRAYIGHLRRCERCRPVEGTRKYCREGKAALDEWLLALKRWGQKLQQDVERTMQLLAS